MWLFALVGGCVPSADTNSPTTGSNGNTARSAERNSASSPLEDKPWRLETIVRNGEPEQVTETLRPAIAYFKSGKVGGRAACNYYGGPYEVDGKKLAIGALMGTSVGCGGHKGEEEKALRRGMQSAESYTVEGDRLTLAFPDGKLIFQALPDVRGDEQAVYAAVLEEWDGGPGPIVIVNKNRIGPAGRNLDDAVDRIRRENAARPGYKPILDAETLSDFRDKNTGTLDMSRVVDLEVPTVFVSEAEIEALFTDGEEAGWSRFKKTYPGAREIISLSRVGFNGNGDQSLVYIGVRAKDYEEGHYDLMNYHSGLWVSTS